jgi:flagella basal body P-ring formation protein FlgA
MRVLLLVVGILLWGTSRAASRGDQLKQAVEEFFRRANHGVTDEVQVEIRNRPELTIPAGAELRIQPSGGSLRGTLIVPVEVIVEGTVLRRTMVTVRVRTFGEVLVAKTLVPKGGLLTAEVIERRRVETTSLADEPLRSEEKLAGMRAARIIMPGTILTRAMVEEQPLVLRSAAVDLEVRSGAVIIVAKAIARGDGRYGEVIEVERPGARERVRATVVGLGRVRCEVQ